MAERNMGDSMTQFIKSSIITYKKKIKLLPTDQRGNFLHILPGSYNFFCLSSYEEKKTSAHFCIFVAHTVYSM